MSARLREYIDSQQSMATRLVGVLEALAALDNEGLEESAQTVLIHIALEMAEEINSALDSVSLPR